MIEIDLLPTKLHKGKIVFFEKIFKAKSVFVVLGFLFVFHVFLHTVTFISTKRLNILEERWQALSGKNTEIEQFKARLAALKAELPLFDQLISDRVLWSKKLNQISDLVIGGIWLNELDLVTRESPVEGIAAKVEHLIIKGSAASVMKNEPALIGRFMQSLKNDPLFSEDFSEIELGPIKKKMIKQTEVMDFILICKFKQDRRQALLR